MLNFIAKEYPWGYTVWIKEKCGKRQVANKLKTIKDVNEFINNKSLTVITK